MSADSPTRFRDFDNRRHPFNKWWRKHGQYMMAGGGRKEMIWAARGWIAREQLAEGAPVTGESLNEKRTKTSVRPMAKIRRNHKARPVALDARLHPVYYRATQVGLSAPCHKRPALTVGMRVAILEERDEFTERIPRATFYAAKVAKIGDGDDPLVTFEYENHPFATSLGAGMKHIAQFCVVLLDETPRLKRSTKRQGRKTV